MKLIFGRTTFIPGFCALLLYGNGFRVSHHRHRAPLPKVTNGYPEGLTGCHYDHIHISMY